MNDCEQCHFLMRECLDCKLLRLEAENAEIQRQLTLVAHERDYLHGESALLEGQRNKARLAARRSFRCAQHLAVMHRRENRVMEGAEGELEAIRREAGGWLTEQNITDE